MLIKRFAMLCAFLAAATVWAEDTSIDAFIRSSGFPGGLIVCVNVRDLGPAVAASRGGDFLIHGLYSEPVALERARTYVSTSGSTGKVTVSALNSSTLPLVGNTANLLIVADGPGIPEREVLRALTPRGKGLLRRDGRWRALEKPVPATIDDWTHNLYDASNLAVSKDVEAGVPRHVQWVGGPRFCRSHNATNSFQAMVSSAGRIFYIMDEGSKAFLSLPPKWFLTARDGFNGKVLWKRPLGQPLISHLDLLKSGIANLAHRIVAQPDHLYVTMGFNAPVSALDSTTGKEIWISPQSANAEELILQGDLLYCVVNLADESAYRHPYQAMSSWGRTPAAEVPRKIIALDTESGRKAWEHKPEALLPLSLTAGGESVFIHNGTGIVALDRVTGRVRWRSEPVAYRKNLPLYAGVNLVLYDKLLLYSCTEDHKNVRKKDRRKNSIIGLDAATGKILWEHEHRHFAQYFAATDLMIADGLIWSAGLYNTESQGAYIGIDPRTGKVVREFKPDPARHMPHHRCHRNRGTERFLFTGRTGIDVFDVRAGTWSHDYWARGTCRYGMMPANGMLYVPPNTCACYVGALVRGFNAMTADSPTRRLPATLPEQDRLVKGPAYARAPDPESDAHPSHSSPALGPSSGWPTYRGSASRHGMAASPMPAAFTREWTAPLKGKLTQPVIAGGRVVVSAIDRHTVHALDQNTGRAAWSFLAGGRVNSPPTIWAGRVLFGCRDGWVYCLALADGDLVWKYRAAPVERRLIAHERLESAWPVDGSVLVLPRTPDDAKAYCVAGRSMFLDGGMRMLVLDAATGRKLSETVMDHRDPKTGESLQASGVWPPDFPTALPDVLSYVKGRIYMGMQPFSTDGKRQDVYYPSRANILGPNSNALPPKKQDTTHDHLYATTGFLDDDQWHRAIWQFGSDTLGACWGVNTPAFVSPSGNILCVDDTKVYGYGREFFIEGTKPTAHLFRCDKNPEVANANRLKDRKVELRGPMIKRNTATTPLWDWSEKIDVYVRAMLVAGHVDPQKPNLILAAGAPDVIEEYDAIDLIKAQQRDGFKLDPVYQKEKAVAGELGAKLIVVSSEDGTVLSETELESPPVFDGMAAANGRLYLSNLNGEVVCLAGGHE